MRLYTRQQYDFYACSSAMQKAIRRNEPKIAGFFALELFHSGFWKYVWKRFYTISAEDCAGIITTEVKALFDGFLMVNEGVKEMNKGRIFISKCALMLCAAPKNRDSDHLQCLVFDKHLISDEEIEQFMKDLPPYLPIPDFAYDVHTAQGKAKGKTKEDFFREELMSITPKVPGLFDNLIQ